MATLLLLHFLQLASKCAGFFNRSLFVFTRSQELHHQCFRKLAVFSRLSKCLALIYSAQLLQFEILLAGRQLCRDLAYAKIVGLDILFNAVDIRCYFLTQVVDLNLQLICCGESFNFFIEPSFDLIDFFEN